LQFYLFLITLEYFGNFDSAPLYLTEKPNGYVTLQTIGSSIHHNESFWRSNSKNNNSSKELSKIFPLIKIKHNDAKRVLTRSTRGVQINHGATQLVLILSFAYSHAKLLVS